MSLDKSKYAASFLITDEEGIYAQAINDLKEDFEWIDNGKFSGWSITVGAYSMGDLYTKVQNVFSKLREELSAITEGK